MPDLSPTTQDKILIVDDVLDNLELLSRILTRRGYAVRSVERGSEAIAIARSGWADLILLDINMPEIDGYEVCRQLKADPNTSSIPVIFLSALDQVLDKVNAFSLGGVDYITKPFQIKEVIARVTTHLQLRNLQKNLEAQVASRTNELTRALQAAKAANSAKSIFFSQITHELRTPMNAIIGFVQLMQRDESLSREHQEQLRIINHSGEHLMALINDVLEVSKIEAGLLVLEKNNFDLYRMLQGIEEMFRLKAQAKSLNFVIQRSDHVPQYVQTDEQKLRQVLINLLANAVKFTPEGQVTLRINYNLQKTNQITFEIEDTGHGITADELTTLFAPFVQTEIGRKSQSGTGLGLSISRQYVQLMGGDITVKSRVNQGSTFSFDIYIDAGQPVSSLPEQRRVIGLQPNLPAPRILVVEDRWENRQFLTQLLEMVGFRVKEAVDGQEAIKLWSSWSPNLILMDLQMPVMDGYEATQHIKRLDQSVVIIALTASKFREQKQFILSSGCDDLMNIPFNEAELWLKIAQYLKVKYIYAQSPPSLNTQLGLDNLNLESTLLAVMPSEWMQQLNYFATAANAKEILNLLEQVPDEHSGVVNAIAKLVDDFCFEQIMDLTQTTNR
ncbi:response regulator [Pleurocapsa sp. PCC 7319]|uniref:response regulator n=1 Tax=Pleurocapsa sp. PCC 7319 TaxID=118161 RepID=UPI00034DE2CC|nr:response regulator [Pleurocapsa sp. PCC 7319]